MALKKWRHYLFSKEYVLYTNNQVLKYINIQVKLNIATHEAGGLLQTYTFVLKHRSRRSNRVFDALTNT
jgi:hypothetical protein